MIKKENIISLIGHLRKIRFNFEEYKLLYNPMEKFLEYVSPKEIVHSMILEDLLNKEGAHGMGDKFIRTFFNQFLGINYSDLSYVNIQREGKVPRVVTEGENRSIDLFIEYAYSKDHPDKTQDPEIKSAIIIENKLNNANYQDKQLLDYYLAKKNAGYHKIDVICLHKYSDPKDKVMEIRDGIRPNVIYPQKLALWLQNSLTIFDFPKSYTLISYITLLNNLNSYNTMQENVNILLSLDKTKFEEVKAIGEAYKKLMDSRLIFLQEGWFNKEFPKTTKIKPISRTKHIQIWNEEVYKRNKLFIVLWERAEGFTLYLASDGKIPETNKYIQTADFNKIDDTEYGYEWYISNDNAKQYFEYPQKEGIERMVKEINRILEILAK